MGAYSRRYERKIEQELRNEVPKGIPDDGFLNGYYDTFHSFGDRSDTSVKQKHGNDVRDLVPPLGLREYWYPAMPAGKVKKKPLLWVMLGEELVFFRNKENEVVALTDICPHRGASLSRGKTYYEGFVTCPYHGATFDDQGECVAWLTEGPDSKMCGNITARKYPTKTLKGWVFIWMGEDEPAPIEEDVPPEFFESERTLILGSYTYWYTNWMVAIENQNDSHNCDFVHRYSIKQLTGLYKGRPRTPIGPRSEIINDRAVTAVGSNGNYYAKDGEVPYQMYYPGVDGVWPKRRTRLLWQWFFQRISKRIRRQKFETPKEWSSAHHLPAEVRVNYGRHMYTRYAVAVKPNMSRIVIFHCKRTRSWIGELYEKVYFYLIHNYLQNYNFSGQDDRVASPCRYWTPEVLSPTDSHLVMLRRLVTERSRDALKRKAKEAVRTAEGLTK